LDLSDLGLGVHSILDLTQRKLTVNRLTENSKYLPPKARLDLTKRLERMVGSNLAHGLMLTQEMVVSLSEQGIDIGAHTVSHPILTSLEDDDARYEIEAGKQQLETLIGKKVPLFAYPNGKVGMDFDQRHAQM